MNAVTPHQDMGERWLPAQDAIDQAVAKLAAEPRAEVAIIPMVQPGKTRRIWTTGQQVETIGTRIQLATSGAADGNVPGWSTARDTACAVARQALAGRPGTVAFAVVERDGHTAVFEDF